MSWRDESPAERVIVALDCGRDEALDLAARLSGRAAWVKVGMTLFYAAGPKIVSQMHSLGFRVFVDLKLHDIPHQVRGAAASLARAGADLMTVHAAGGEAMMAAAVEGARPFDAQGTDPASRMAVCAVTVLTSMDAASLFATGISDSPASQVARLASLSRRAGVDGVVCSPMEAADMRALLGPDALVVTPGVRPAGSESADQARTSTPAEALAAGASHLVIGRPITAAADPQAAFDGIVSSL